MDIKRIALTILVLTLSACGSKKVQKPSAEPEQKRVIFYDTKKRDSEFANWEVKCEGSAQCSSSVGQLVVKVGATQAAVCSGFLADAGKAFITNDHCLQELREGSACDDQAVIVFPAISGRPSQRVVCGKIRERSFKKDFSDADLAIIDLLEPIKDRESLEIDTSGVKDGEKLELLAIDPSGSHRNNVYRKSTCKVVYSPFYLAQFQDSSDPSLSFTGCHLEVGNSGAPLIDPATGKVKAIAFGLVERNELSRYLALVHMTIFGQTEDPLEHRDLLGKKFNLATNAACLSSDGGRLNPAGCPKFDEATRMKIEDDRRTESARKIGEEVAEIFGKWSVTNSKFIVWNYKPVTLQGGQRVGFFPVPFCVQPSENWASEYKTESVLPWAKYPEAVSADFPAPQLILKLRYNSSLRPYMSLDRSTVTLVVKFSPEDLTKDQGGTVTIGETEYKVKSCGKVLTPSEISN